MGAQVIQIREQLSSASSEFARLTQALDTPDPVERARKCATLERRALARVAEANGDQSTADLLTFQDIVSRQGARLVLRWAQQLAAVEA